MEDLMIIGKTPAGKVVRFRVVEMANGRFCFHADDAGYPAYNALSDTFCCTLLWKTWPTIESAAAWLDQVLEENNWHREEEAKC